MVDIILPTSFNFISSTATLGGQNDSLYTFFIDDVLVNSTGGFQIIVEHDCSNENTGLTHELLARIIPDEICLPDDPIWDEASIELKAEIVGNNVQFVIENVGRLLRKEKPSDWKYRKHLVIPDVAILRLP